MRFDLSMVRRVAILAVVSPALVAGATAGNKKGQARRNSWATVNSGSVGILLPGQRVATQSFAIRQQASTSPIPSQLKETSAADPASRESQPAEKPFLMANISAIVGNNFFLHPELPVWRYLAAASSPGGSSFQWQQDPEDFGVLGAQDRSCASAWDWWGRKKYKFPGVTASHAFESKRRRLQLGPWDQRAG